MDATMTTGTGPGTTTGDADMMSIVVDAAPTADAGFPTLPFDASTPVTTITDASNDAGATPTLSAGCRTSPGRRESGDALLFALGVLGVVATGRISRRRQR
jgi:hypothetical protein